MHQYILQTSGFPQKYIQNSEFCNLTFRNQE